MFVFNRKIRLFAFFSVLLLIVPSCAQKSEAGTDILTQKKAADGKIPITISTKYAVDLNEFEKAAEEKFPTLDLIQVGNFTANDSTEYAQQLANDDLTDIVVTWPLDQSLSHCEERLIDLSGMPFTSRYNTSTLNSMSDGGKLYYLPGLSQLRGILYNKTMFDQHGWKAPDNFEEFVSLCKQIEASGIRPLQLSFQNKEVLRYAFIGFGFNESFGSPEALQALEDYNNGIGSMRDFALPAFQSYERLIKEGILRPEDLTVRYPVREQMLADRRCAMVSDGVSLISGMRNKGNMDEFALMPFFSPGENGYWGHVIVIQNIGLNKNLTKPENKKKYELALELMDFISTHKGQMALAAENNSMISNLEDSPLPDAAEMYPMKKSVAEGRYAIFPEFTNVADTLYDALAAMLRGQITMDQAIAAVDKENQAPSEEPEEPAIGKAAETFSLMEAGSYVTDVIRKQAGTDLALFLDNGKDGTFNARGISAKFYKGDIRESDVTKRVLPVLQHGEAGYLNTVTVTGENLIKVLEYTLPDGDWFYYFSGLKMTFDPTETPGKRIKQISLEDGSSIQPEKLYSIAVMEGTVDADLLESCKVTDILVKDLIIQDIRQKKEITPAHDGRFRILQQ